MWWKRIATVSLVAGMFVSVVASGVGATEHDPVFETGDYVLVIPGVGEFVVEVDYVVDSDGETVIAVAVPEGYEAPEGYELDDDDPAKAAWKQAAGLEVEILEVEMKLDKIESDVTWDGGVATLKLPDGSIITVFAPIDGDFRVEASGIWTAFGWGDDWIVADEEEFEDIGAETQIFKVEATAHGIEIKAISEPGDGFEYEEEYEYEDEEAEEVESEDDDSEGAGHGKEKNQGKGKNN